MLVRVPTLVTERLILTIPGAGAANRLATYIRKNEAHLAPWNPPLDALATDAGAGARLEDDRERLRLGSSYRFCIFLRSAGLDDAIIGRVNFSNIFRGAFQACHLGYDLAESAQGQGYMAEAIRAGADDMFHEIRLHRIMANYIPTNVRSAAVLKRLGFTIEGTAKEYLFIAGRWQDHVLTSLINPSPLP
jgi:ribosomal-protein-alanine N-acetyltransferase